MFHTFGKLAIFWYSGFMEKSGSQEQGIIERRQRLAKATGLDWRRIWQQIRRARSFRGKIGNLSKVVEEGRKQINGRFKI